MHLRLLGDELCIYECKVEVCPHNACYEYLTSRVLVTGERAAVAGEFLLFNLDVAKELVIEDELTASLELRSVMNVKEVRRQISKLMQSKAFR